MKDGLKVHKYTWQGKVRADGWRYLQHPVDQRMSETVPTLQISSMETKVLSEYCI